MNKYKSRHEFQQLHPVLDPLKKRLINNSLTDLWRLPNLGKEIFFEG